ncbi:hypothetical protein K491DRAFT_196013 [Lophiostoma macrostomum CBS 122681]|uniref:Uncharacterized protein n=1 Tax=Lophiostoma macrostomum CBS 122681 TaxID=1314788 RepID=A0A6A6TJ56_9PLEO|nr:hypothetical protein K491DRAFT_196013 [Lophiostoma macrostomum CBS 122681]
MSSPSTPMSRGFSSKTEETAGYRIVEYRNGSVVCVQETRRRPRHHQAKSDAGQYSRTHHYELFDMRNNPTSSVIVESVHCSIEAKEKMNLPLYHVTSLPMRPRAKKPVITQEAADTDDHATIGQPLRFPAMLTPPSTPKIERLPTPELPEVEECAFCDCCEAGPHVVHYCASCGVAFGN